MKYDILRLHLRQIFVYLHLHHLPLLLNNQMILVQQKLSATFLVSVH
jgi:hypothetical protein